MIQHRYIVLGGSVEICRRFLIKTHDFTFRKKGEISIRYGSMYILDVLFYTYL